MNEQVTSVAVSIASRLSSGDSLRAGAQPAGTRVENLVQAFLQLVTAHAGQQWRLVDYARALHVTRRTSAHELRQGRGCITDEAHP